MSEGARVRSVEALRPLRAGLLEFCREVASVLTSAESEIARMADWLERDRVAHWKAEAQRRRELLTRAKSDLYRAQIQKKSLVDEKKAIARAKAAVDDAEARLEAARRWSVRLEQERALFAGAVNGLSVAVSVELPRAAAKLELMSRSLEDYLAVVQEGAEGADDTPATIREAMSRGGGMPTRDAIVEQVLGLVPGALERESAAGIEAAGVALGTRRVSEIVGDIAAGGDVLDERLRVVLDARITRAELLLFVRSADVLPGDSGWFVTPAPGAPGERRLVAATIGALRAAWPDVSAVWGMDAGAIVALEGERVRVVRASGTIRDQEDRTP